LVLQIKYLLLIYCIYNNKLNIYYYIFLLQSPFIDIYSIEINILLINKVYFLINNSIIQWWAKVLQKKKKKSKINLIPI